MRRNLDTSSGKGNVAIGNGVEGGAGASLELRIGEASDWVEGPAEEAACSASVGCRVLGARAERVQAEWNRGGVVSVVDQGWRGGRAWKSGQAGLLVQP